MEKWIEIILILLLALAVAGMIMLAGCTASEGDDGGQQYAGNNGGAGAPYAGSLNGTRWQGGFGNATDSQRQQMMQALESACDGKAPGDACEVQGGAGSMQEGVGGAYREMGGAQRGINGTCSARNGTLACAQAGIDWEAEMGKPQWGNGTGREQPTQDARNTG